MEAADAKQKISLGRGLVREDVSAVLFDEPLTVIDPHLKWHLRRKLKQIHHELKLTLIYVTHDQVEALTFAQEVVVMTRGRVVQIGTASELYERPRHTFVGNFIGSPGMNFMPARWNGEGITVAGHALQTAADPSALAAAGTFTLGVRPEYVSLADAGDPSALPGEVLQRQDVGTYWLLTARCADLVVRVRLDPESSVPQIGQHVWLKVTGAHTCYYDANDELIASADGAVEVQA